MDPRAQLAKLKQVSLLERESKIPEFCEALLLHMFTVPAQAAQARNVLEYTLGQIMTRMPEIEEEAVAENMEGSEAPYSPGAGATLRSPGSGATPRSPGAGAAPYSPGAGATLRSPGAGAAPYSPGAGAAPFPSRHSPPPVIKRRTNGKRSDENDENDDEGMIDPEHLASVAWQLASEQPHQGLIENLESARRSGSRAVLELCLKKLRALFENDIKAKGTMKPENIMLYTTGSYTSKEELDIILQRVFDLSPVPTRNEQADELLRKYNEGVRAIMGFSKGGRRKSRRSRRKRRRSTLRG